MRWLICIAFGPILLLAACSGDSDSPSGADASRVPSSVVVGNSTPDPGSTQTSKTSSDPGPISTAQFFEGLWSGLTEPGSSLSDLAFRVTPGADPDSDLWTFQSLFPVGVIFGAPSISCTPTSFDGGWRLAACSGLPPDSTFLAIVTQDPPSVQITASFGPAFPTFELTLSKTEPLEEPSSSDNVTVLWHSRGPGPLIYTDVVVQEGIVIAPRYGENIELLDAATGDPLGVARSNEAAQTGPGIPGVLDVRVVDHYLFAATQTRGLLVFDVQDPSQPRLLQQVFLVGDLSTTENFFNVHNIQLSPDGGLLYAVNVSPPVPDLRIFDITEPADPVEVGRFRMDMSNLDNAFHDLNLVERDGAIIAFLNSTERGFLVLDVTDPSSIEILSQRENSTGISHSGWAYESAAAHYYAHAEEGVDTALTIYNVDDLSNPIAVSSFKLREGISVHNVEVADGVAYVSYLVDGLRVLDLRDPANIVQIAHYDTVPPSQERDIFQGAWGVALWNGIVFVSDMEGGIYAFKVELPGD